MTYWTSDALKVKYAQEYFSSFNSMTARIIEKQSQIASAFPPGEWEKLPVDDKEKIINQHMIIPEEASRYKSTKNGQLPKYYKSVFPKLLVEYGQSYASHNEDDINQAMWQDEHSGPFSWETKSQMNFPLPRPSAKRKSKLKIAEKQKDVTNHLIPDFEEVKAPPKLLNGGANDVHEKPFKSFQLNGLKENGDHHSINDNVKKPSVTSDSMKLDFNLTKPTIHKEPKQEQDPPRFSLPEKEVKTRPNTKKGKPSSRINPRSSLTLDDEEHLFSKDKSGAIRNLEIAMQEERKEDSVQEKQAPSPSVQLNLPKTSVQAAPQVVEDEIASIPQKDSPLLENNSPSLSLSFEDFELEPDSPHQKSGFDFLDNW